MWPFRTKRNTPKEMTYISIPGERVRVTLTEAKGFTPAQMEKIKEALLIISTVVNSDNFRERVLAIHVLDDSDTAWELYMRLIRANEVYASEGEDHEMDLSLRYYTRWWSKVIGYVVPGSIWINLNWKYHGSFTTVQMASNIFHEWVHCLGLKHEGKNHEEDTTYLLGHLMGALGEQMYEEAMGLKDKVEVITRRIP